MAPIVADIESVLPMVDPVASAPVLAGQFLSGDITDNSDGTFAIAKGNLALSANSDYVGALLIAMDGLNKGQRCLVLACASATGFTITPLRVADDATTFRIYTLPWPIAVSTTNGDTTTVNATGRGAQADDYFNGDYLFGLWGANKGEVVAISDFATTTGAFTVATMGAASVLGDLYLVISKSIMFKDVKAAVPLGKPIVREVKSNTLDTAAGIVPGAAEPPSIDLSVEIRGLSAAATATATRPVELGKLLAAVFNEVLGVGDTAKAGTVTAPQVDAATGWVIDTLAMLRGEVFAVNAVTDGSPVGDTTLGVPAGHLSAAPVASDVVYGAANYQAVDTGHLTSSFLVYHGGTLASLICGALPAIKGTVPDNGILQLDLAYKGVSGAIFDLAQAHDDDLDVESIAVPGLGATSRIVFNGAAVTVDIMSAEFNLHPDALGRGRAFSALDNRSGPYYGKRQAGCSLKVRLEDTDFLALYQKGATADFLLQVGVVPTAAFALWASRAQIISEPMPVVADGFYEITLELAFLQPTDESRPAFVLGVL